MMHYGSVPFDMNTVRWGYPTTDNGFCLTPNVTQGKSRGTVRLRSRDFRDRAKVDPRYFTDPDGHDLAVMTAGIRLARRIVEQAEMAGWAGAELAPGKDVVTDDEIADYARRRTTPSTTRARPRRWARPRTPSPSATPNCASGECRGCGSRTGPSCRSCRP